MEFFIAMPVEHRLEDEGGFMIETSETLSSSNKYCFDSIMTK